MKPLDFNETLKETVKLWKLTSYSKLLTHLKNVPRDIVLEVLVCAGDAVDLEKREGFLQWLGKDSDEHLDLYIMLGCEPAFKAA